MPHKMSMPVIYISIYIQKLFPLIRMPNEETNGKLSFYVVKRICRD